MKAKGRLMLSMDGSTGNLTRTSVPHNRVDVQTCTRRGYIECRTKTKRRQHTSPAQAWQRALWCHADTLYRIMQKVAPSHLWAWYSGLSRADRENGSAHSNWMHYFMLWQLEGFLVPFLGCKLVAATYTVEAGVITVHARFEQDTTATRDANVITPKPVRYR